MAGRWKRFSFSNILWPGCYHAWREEYGRYTGEVAKYKSPDISGEAFNFSGYQIQGHDRTDWSASYEVRFEVIFRNHSPINTKLNRIELDGTRLTPAFLFDFGAPLGESAFPVGLEMPQGIGKQITVRVAAMVGGLRMRQIPPIALDNLAVHITGRLRPETSNTSKGGGAPDFQ